MGICDPRNKEIHPALCCENLNIIELGNVRRTHKSNPNCGYRLLYCWVFFLETAKRASICLDRLNDATLLDMCKDVTKKLVKDHITWSLNVLTFPA